MTEKSNSTILPTQPFGATGLDLPPIVFGTASLGNMMQVISPDAEQEIVEQWFAQTGGLVAVDTAGKYGAGLALERIGRQLKRLGKTADDIVISNKLGWRRIPLTTPEPTFEADIWHSLEHDATQDISYDGILRCYEEGLELLDGAPCQLVSVHDPDEYIAAATDDADREKRWDDVGGAYQALTELKQTGKVAGVGVGAKNWETIREFSERFALDWVMIANCFTIHSHPVGLIEFLSDLQSKNIAVMNAAVFNGGFLVGSDFYNYHRIDMDSQFGKSLYAWREQFVAICSEFGVNVAEACVRFGNSSPAINTVALSSSRAARVASNVKSVSAKIPAEFWAALKTRGLVDQSYPYL